MRLIYREGVTPDDYEPEGFESAGPSACLHFKTKPVHVDMRNQCTTAHHSLSVSCLYVDEHGHSAEDGNGKAADVRRVRASGKEGGASAQTTYAFDLFGPSMAVPPPVPPADHEEEEEGIAEDAGAPPAALVATFVDAALAVVQARSDGEALPVHELAAQLHCPPAVAEAVLTQLEELGWVSSFRPKLQARQVRKSRPKRSAFAAGMESAASDGASQASADDAEEGEESAAPSPSMPHAKRRAQRTPATTGAPGGRAPQPAPRSRKSSRTTSTVQSQATPSVHAPTPRAAATTPRHRR